MPFKPDGIYGTLVIVDIIIMITAMPYPMLKTVANTADQNPIFPTAWGMDLMESISIRLFPIFERISVVVLMCISLSIDDNYDFFLAVI